MRLDTGDIMADEFDAYFARAQSSEKEIPQISYRQRGSNPDVAKNIDGPCLTRAKSCKSNYRRRGSTKGTPTRDLPTLVRAEIDSETEAGECAGLSDSFNENKLKESYRLLEVKCHSEPQSRSPSWKSRRDPVRYASSRSDTITRRSSQDISTQLDFMTLDVPTDNHLAIRRNVPSPSLSSSRKTLQESHDLSSSPVPTRRRRRFDRMARSSRSKSVIDMAEVSSSAGSDSPPLEVTEEVGDDIGGPNLGSKIHLIGDYGVGKKSIVQQFKSKSLFSHPSIHDDVETHTTLITKLDGNHEKIKITVIPSEMHHTSFGDADVYVIVYSVVDRATFSHAIDILHEIRRDQSKYRAVVLAANKGDLVRSRQVSEEEAKQAAKSYNCKCVEVSVVLNHRIGDLLNTSMKQLRVSHKKQERESKRNGSIKDKDTKSGSAAKPKRNFIGRLFRSKSFAATKSCENLLTVS